jgi:eukaryotic translation initiation factor 2C
MLLLFFSVMCAWLGSVHSLVDHDFEIQHLEKVVFRGVNRVVMEHLVKLYKESVLGYRLLAYDGCKNLCTIGPIPFPSKEFQINLIGEDDNNNTQRFLNQILHK